MLFTLPPPTKSHGNRKNTNNTHKIRWQKRNPNKSVITINVSGLNLAIKDRDYQMNFFFFLIKIRL